MVESSSDHPTQSSPPPLPLPDTSSPPLPSPKRRSSTRTCFHELGVANPNLAKRYEFNLDSFQSESVFVVNASGRIAKLKAAAGVLGEADLESKFEVASGSLLRGMKKQRKGELELPKDVILWNILPRLPVKSILRFKSVCKDWQSLISDNRDFAKLQLQFQNNYDNDQYCFVHTRCDGPCNCCGTRLISLKLNTKPLLSPIPGFKLTPLVAAGLAIGRKPNIRKFPNNVKVLGSSNGLICLSHEVGCELTRCTRVIRRYELWNPATRGRWSIPRPPQIVDHRYRNVSEGFGHIPSLDDYKIVILKTIPNSEPKIYYALIFSCRTNSWKQIKLRDRYKDYLPNSYFSGNAIGGVQVGESLHWGLYWKTDHNPNLNPVVLVFNLANNFIHGLMVPRSDPERPISIYFGVSKIRERLCVVWPYKTDNGSCRVNVIYMLAEDELNWKKMFTFEDDLQCLNLVRSFSVLQLHTILLQLDSPDPVDYLCNSANNYIQTLITPFDSNSHRGPTIMLPTVDL